MPGATPIVVPGQAPSQHDRGATPSRAERRERRRMAAKRQAQRETLAAATFAIWGLWLHRLESLCVNTHYIEERLGVLTHNPPRKPRKAVRKPRRWAARARPSARARRSESSSTSCAARPKPLAIAQLLRDDHPRQLLDEPAADAARLDPAALYIATDFAIARPWGAGSAPARGLDEPAARLAPHLALVATGGHA